MKIVTIVGARPQFIKASVVSRALAAQTGVTEKILHTGQHFDHAMSRVFFDELGIAPPDVNLGVHGLSHGAMTGRMLEGIERVLCTERPDWVLVYGDTNSTLAGAMAGAKLGIPVAHVEAGLRSFDMSMPEEVNRVVADRVSRFLFCPTDTAVKNLKNEGVESGGGIVEKVGDVMLDVALQFGSLSKTKEEIVAALGLDGREFVVATIHRQENVADSERLVSILRALDRINEQVPVIVPFHPRTKARVAELGHSFRFTEIEPLGYLEMTALVKRCAMVMTDSGGLQKEACFHKKPSVVFRDRTEWVELAERRNSILAGADTLSILKSFDMAKSSGPPEFDPDLFGGGKASERIAQVLVRN